MTESTAPITAPIATATTPTTEAPKAEAVQAPEAAEKDARTASKLALLSRREREVFQKEKQAKEKLSKVEAWEKASQSAKQNPLQFIEANGLSLEDVVKYALNQNAPPSKEALHEQALKTVNEKLAEIERREQEKVQQAQKAYQDSQIKDIKNQLDNMLANNSEKYEAINLYNRSEDVFQLMFDSYDQSKGKIQLTFEQAAQLVENQLQEDANKEAARLQKLKRFQKAQPEDKNQSRDSKEPRVKQSTTLTNSLASSSPAHEESKELLSREESIKRLALKLQQTRK